MFLLIVPFFLYFYQVQTLDVWFIIAYLDWALTPFFIGLAYKRRIVDKRHEFPKKVPKTYRLGRAGRSYKHELADFCVEVEYCAYACCCTCLYARLGDTFATTGAGNYWTINLLCIIPHMLTPIIKQVATEAEEVAKEYGHNEFTGIFTETNSLIFVCCMYFALSLYLAKKRQGYRGRLGDKGAVEKCSGFCCDALLIFACTSCVAVQDARQVDESTLTRVECCCRLVHTETPAGITAVGGPVKVASMDEGTFANTASMNSRDSKSRSNLGDAGSVMDGDEFVKHSLLPEPLPEQVRAANSAKKAAERQSVPQAPQVAGTAPENPK